MSASEISSSSIFVILSIASKLQLVLHSINGWDIIHLLSYNFYMFQTHKLRITHHILSNNTLKTYSYSLPIIFFTCQQTIKLCFAWKSFFKPFKIIYILIRINPWLHYSKSSLYKFLTKLSNQELKRWKLSTKTKL